MESRLYRFLHTHLIFNILEHCITLYVFQLFVHTLNMFMNILSNSVISTTIILNIVNWVWEFIICSLLYIIKVLFYSVYTILYLSAWNCTEFKCWCALFIWGQNNKQQISDLIYLNDVVSLYDYAQNYTTTCCMFQHHDFLLVVLWLIVSRLY